LYILIGHSVPEERSLLVGTSPQQSCMPTVPIIHSLTKSPPNMAAAALASSRRHYGSNDNGSIENEHRSQHGRVNARSSTSDQDPTEVSSDVDEMTPLLKGDVSPTPLPIVQLLIILFLRVTEPIAYMVCFPFINQMLLDIGAVDDPKKAGFYAGIVSSRKRCLS
jgi:hypothetical protein